VHLREPTRRALGNPGDVRRSAEAPQRTHNRSEIIVLIATEPAQPDEPLNRAAWHFDDKPIQRVREGVVGRPGVVGRRRERVPASAQRARCRTFVPNLRQGQGPVRNGIKGPAPHGGMEGPPAEWPTKSLCSAPTLPRPERPIAPSAPKPVTHCSFGSASLGERRVNAG